MLNINGKRKTWHTETSILRRFHPYSPLHLYLTMNYPNEFWASKTAYSMDLICYKLQVTIRKKGLCDSKNPSIILCDKGLEMALGTPYLDQSQLNEYVNKQMCPSSQIDVKFLVDYLNLVSFGRLPPKKIIPVPAAKEQKDLDSITYCLNPDFLQLIRQVPDVPKTKHIFTLGEIASAVIKYLAMNHLRLDIDPRNYAIAFIKDDPLGKIFNVSAFHKNQLRYFISKVTRQISLNSFISIKKKYPTLRKVSQKTIKKTYNPIQID